MYMDVMVLECLRFLFMLLSSASGILILFILYVTVKHLLGHYSSRGDSGVRAGVL